MVVNHDFHIRLPDGRRRLARYMTMDEIIAVRPENTGLYPTLAEALSYIDGRVPILIDTKHFSFPGRFEDTLLAYLSDYQGEVAIQSFNPFTVRYIGNQTDQYLLGLLLWDMGFLSILATLRDNLFSMLARAHFLSYQMSAAERFGVDFSFYRNRGIPVLGWTVYLDSLEAEQLRLESGRLSWHDPTFVDNIIFEASR
jgi:glycerophosphoryl diester phosphodiesterase